MSTEPDAAKTRRQFSKVPKWIWEHNALADLDVRIYAYLALAASPHGFTRRSAPTIATRLGAPRHPATIRRAIDRLEKAGAITVDRKTGRTPLIYVHADLLAAAEKRIAQVRFDLE
jgi:DNA-binding MarR family transcriptional regulator